MARRVSCIPSDDEALAQTAMTALDGIDGQIGPDGVASVLAGLLRGTYPAIEVHRQNPLARVFDDDVWYVYREGKPFGVGDPNPG
jgi:hypothetical protein